MKNSLKSTLLIPFGLGCTVVDTQAFGLSKAFQVVVVKNGLPSFSSLFLLSPSHQRVFLILVQYFLRIDTMEINSKA